MKTLITIITLLCLQFAIGQQNYNKGMSKAFELWKAQQTDEAANLFERIAGAEKENWIPFYYAAQIHIISTYNTKEGKEIESRLAKAQNLVNEAKTFSDNNAEVLVLEAMLNTAYVAYKPNVYGMKLSAKVEELYQQAKALEPNNPRAILYHAEWKMGSARFWGKDPKAFCPEVEKAILYFENAEEPKVPFYPHWGMKQVTRVQKICNQS
ncbi:hypothetical protein [Aquimarina brevivitae]|uniref:Tetratricopeptide repeat protein n=1 Tax=Aquimarina brevivitae TaxID=323412 RepID=A0A4Q7P0X2_9FLAO|nr:hypothetical protein [Aquimarina brevivitae]RZS93345.1 hypothetical protein EV197_1923 [Aquimarina brevivitae]